LKAKKREIGTVRVISARGFLWGEDSTCDQLEMRSNAGDLGEVVGGVGFIFMKKNFEN
jgi:hypothetical protein